MEDEIIKQAEKNCNTDPYYLELLKEDRHSALAYRYGMVTMALAIEINKLKQ